jgi:hypothetical protein
LKYLGRVVGAGAGNFFEALGGKRRQSREMQLALVEEALSHAAAGQGDQQDRPAFAQQLADRIRQAPAEPNRPRQDWLPPRAGYPARVKVSTRVSAANRIFSSRRPVAGAAQRDGRRQGGVVVILAEPALQQRVAVSALDIGQVLQLEAFLGGVRQQVEKAGRDASFR